MFKEAEGLCECFKTHFLVFMCEWGVSFSSYIQLFTSYLGSFLMMPSFCQQKTEIWVGDDKQGPIEWVIVYTNFLL